MAVDKINITLPVANWQGDSNIWKLFEDARARKSDNILFQLHGKSGLHLNDVLQIIARCDFECLNFLGLNLLESDRGTILHASELASAIDSLNSVIDELLKAIHPLSCVCIGNTVNEQSMLKAFNNSQIYQDEDIGSYEEEGLFILLKSLLWVMNDALANNKLFVYFMFFE